MHNSSNQIKHWTEGLERILLEQQNKCAAYKWLHEHECLTLRKRNKYLNIITIFIVSASATISTITNNIEGHQGSIFIIRIIYPLFLYFAAILTSLQQFLNYEKEAEKHRASVIRYSALYNNIRRMLSLDKENRQNAGNYFTWVNKEYDNIFSSASDINSSTIVLFETKFSTNFNYLHVENSEKISDPPQEIVVLNEIESVKDPEFHVNNKIKTDQINIETEKLKYELDRFMNSLN